MHGPRGKLSGSRFTFKNLFAHGVMRACAQASLRPGFTLEKGVRPYTIPLETEEVATSDGE